jgi:hypothetical protein
MAMAELKTRKTEASVEDFIAAQKDERTRNDCRAIIALMSAATKAPPKMWGPAIVGFGSRRLTYPSGRELDWMICGFSPRKANLTLYLPASLEALAPRLTKLGQYTTGKGCLYIKRLSDVDMKVLKSVVEASLKEVKKSTGK